MDCRRAAVGGTGWRGWRDLNNRIVSAGCGQPPGGLGMAADLLDAR
jgi:hypothetical protein